MNKLELVEVKTISLIHPDCPICAITHQEIKKLTTERLPVFKFQLISDTEEQVIELGLSNMVYLLNNQGKTVDRIPVYIPNIIE